MSAPDERSLARPCPVCANAQGSVLHEQRFVLPEGHPLGDSYEVVTCSSCGAAFADTAVPQEEYDAYYARFSKYDDAELSTGGGGSPSDAARLAATAAVIADGRERSARILDIGSAGGGLLHALRDLGFSELVGVDPSAACVAYGRDTFGLEMHQGTLASLPAIGDFDLIILSHVLEHVEDVGEAVATLRSLLREGGELYIEVPDAMRYREFLVAPFQDFNTEHINHFSARSLENLAAASGLVMRSGAQTTIESTADVPYPAVWQIWGSPADEAPEIAFDTELRPELERYVGASKQMMDAFAERIVSAVDRPVAVWGAGQLTNKLLAETALGDAQIVAFVDGNAVFHGTRLKGVPIAGPEAIGSPDIPIVIASTIHQAAITRRIREDLNLGNPLITLA